MPPSIRAAGGVLVVSCYELGRQPAAAARALAHLDAAGFPARALDVSVERLDEEAVRAAALIAIAVPMHTALRLGVSVAAKARALNPSAHVSFLGLYATLNAPHLLARHGDSCIGGEADEPLVALARALAAALEAGRIDPGTGRPMLPALPGVATAAHPEGPWLPRAAQVRASALLPLRAGLPPLEKYARLQHGAEERLAASVEATRGCKHLCRHCPIVPVYGGRFFALPAESVLADIEQQLAAGARHVSFGDPDFFNGPRHAMAIAGELHRRWPGVTFDATIKIEHLLAHRELLPELGRSGCLFITSAVESLSGRVLRALDKGHTADDIAAATRLVRAAGIDLRPTLLPYTPWAQIDDVRALFDFAQAEDLVEEIDPVQFTLRLLLPPGTPLVDGPPPLPDDDRSWLGPFDAAGFTWTWTHPDPRMDELQRASASTAKRAAEQAMPQREAFEALRELAEVAVAGAPSRRVHRPEAQARRPARTVPRLTEPWFC